MAAGIAAQAAPAAHAPHRGAGGAPSYSVEVERLAAAWATVGLPLPHDYNTPDARPGGSDDRVYAASRGPGDGRRLQPGAVLPTLLRSGGATGDPSPHRVWRRAGKAGTVPAVSTRGQ
eukprot:5657184-Pleurochrysis_carterae.AAC.1